MRMMVQKKTEAEGSGTEAPARPQTTLVVWINDGPVCVSIIDEPRRAHESACRCGGCHASAQADLPSLFLPD
jgi:hypothetical protein